MSTGKRPLLPHLAQGGGGATPATSTQSQPSLPNNVTSANTPVGSPPRFQSQSGIVPRVGNSQTGKVTPLLPHQKAPGIERAPSIQRTPSMPIGSVPVSRGGRAPLIPPSVDQQTPQATTLSSSPQRTQGGMADLTSPVLPKRPIANNSERGTTSTASTSGPPALPPKVNSTAGPAPGARIMAPVVPATIEPQPVTPVKKPADSTRTTSQTSSGPTANLVSQRKPAIPAIVDPAPKTSPAANTTSQLAGTTTTTTAAAAAASSPSTSGATRPPVDNRPPIVPPPGIGRPADSGPGGRGPIVPPPSQGQTTPRIDHRGSATAMLTSRSRASSYESDDLSIVGDSDDDIAPPPGPPLASRSGIASTSTPSIPSAQSPHPTSVVSRPPIAAPPPAAGPGGMQLPSTLVRHSGATASQPGAAAQGTAPLSRSLSRPQLPPPPPLNSRSSAGSLASSGGGGLSPRGPPPPSLPQTPPPPQPPVSAQTSASSIGSSTTAPSSIPPLVSSTPGAGGKPPTGSTAGTSSQQRRPSAGSGGSTPSPPLGNNAPAGAARSPLMSYFASRRDAPPQPGPAGSGVTGDEPPKQLTRKESQFSIKSVDSQARQSLIFKKFYGTLVHKKLREWVNRGRSAAENQIARKLQVKRTAKLGLEQQRERILTEIPRAVHVHVIEEAYPVVLESVTYYRAQLGMKNSFTQQAIEHLRKLARILGRECEY